MTLLGQAVVSSTATMAAPLVSIDDSMSSLDSYTWRASDGWNNGAPFNVGWRADHVDIYANQLRLTLDNTPCVTNAASCSNQPYAAGEYSSAQLLGYGQVDFYAQPAAMNGVVTGLFLYTGSSDGNPHDEIDIEFLGNDTTQVQFNYYVGGVGGHEKLMALGFDASKASHHYTIAWSATDIRWYVDGVLQHTVSGVTLPSSPMRIFSNIWATTGVDTWAGAFIYPNAPIYAYVDRLVYHAEVAVVVNSGAGTTGGGCLASRNMFGMMPLLLWLSMLMLWKYRRR